MLGGRARGLKGGIPRLPAVEGGTAAPSRPWQRARLRIRCRQSVPDRAIGHAAYPAAAPPRSSRPSERDRGLLAGERAGVEAAGRLDDLIRGGPPPAVPERAERGQDLGGLLGGLGRGGRGDPVRAYRA